MTPRFEDVAIGQTVGPLLKGPLGTPHLVRWSAASENWHRIHYDRPFATGHDGLPDLLINGSLKQQFVVQLLKDWAGPEGWLWKVDFQFRAMNQVGQTLRIWGRVTALQRSATCGLVNLDVGVLDDDERESTPGTAVVALPLRDGPPLPYPFVAPEPAGGTAAAPAGAPQ